MQDETEVTTTRAASSKGGSRGSYRNGRRTREQIISASMALLSQRGYNGSSLRQIAVAVGIAPGAITRHFESKDELLSAVLESWAKMTRAAQGDTGGDGVRHWEATHQLMVYHVQNPGLLRLFIMLAAEATGPDHPARGFMVLRYRRTIQELSDALLAAAARGDIDLISRPDAEREARSFIAYLDGIEIQWLLNPQIDIVAEVDQYLTTTFSRLGRQLPSAGDEVTPGA